MITPTFGWLSRSSRAASSPSISGIRMSIKAMSGVSVWTRSRSSLPLAASPTTSIPSAMSRYLRSPWRTREWSSAIATLIVTVPSCPPCIPARAAPGFSEDELPVDEQEGKQGKPPRECDKRRRFGRPAPLGGDRPPPRDREHDGHEPWHRQQWPARERQQKGQEHARGRVHRVAERDPAG